jgi:hypothetical protein
MQGDVCSRIVTGRALCFGCTDTQAGQISSVTVPVRDSDSDASASHGGPGSQGTPRAAGRAAGPGRFNLKLGRARIRIHHRHSDSEVSMDIEGVVVLIELVTVFISGPFTPEFDHYIHSSF